MLPAEPSNSSLSIHLVPPSAFPTFDTQRSVRLPCGQSGSRVASANLARAPLHVCVVSGAVASENRWRWSGTSVGHAAEFLFKCSSFWEQALDDWEERASEKMPPEAQLRPQRAILSTLGRVSSHFTTTFLSALNVTWLKRTPSDCAVLWAVPTRGMYPGYGLLHFARSTDAWRLASALSRTPLADRPGLLAGETWRHGIELRVGWLQRGPTRHSGREWESSASVIALLRKPDSVSLVPPTRVASADSFFLHNLSWPDQVRSIREYDIILTAHGSHGITLPFIRPCTVVVILVHTTYLIDQLAEYTSRAGGRALIVHARADLGRVIRLTLDGVSGDGTHVRSLELERRKRETSDFSKIDVGDFVREVIPAAVHAHQQCLGVHSGTKLGLDQARDDFVKDRQEQAQSSVEAGGPLANALAVGGKLGGAHNVVRVSTPIANDGIPRLGGPLALNLENGEATIVARARGLSCHESAVLDCRSVVAQYAYGDGAVACEHCLPYFRNMSSAEVCRSWRSAAKAQGIVGAHCRLPDNLHVLVTST